MSRSNKRTAVMAFGVVWGVIILGTVAGQVKPVESRPQEEPEKPPLPTDEVTWKLIAEDLVKERLRDPDSAEFSDLKVYQPNPDQAATICGYVNSRNGFGGMTGRQRFIAGGTVLVEEQVTAKQMQIAWNEVCK
ncbi:MAG: hypothetical protein AAGB23_10500 [Pseudomonadota bacterium]